MLGNLSWFIEPTSASCDSECCVRGVVWAPCEAVHGMLGGAWSGVLSGKAVCWLQAWWKGVHVFVEGGGLHVHNQDARAH